MIKTTVAIYLVFSSIVIFAGIYIAVNVMGTPNPGSLGSKFEKLKETLDENIDVP